MHRTSPAFQRGFCVKRIVFRTNPAYPGDRVGIQEFDALYCLVVVGDWEFQAWFKI